MAAYVADQVLGDGRANATLFKLMVLMSLSFDVALVENVEDDWILDRPTFLKGNLF